MKIEDMRAMTVEELRSRLGDLSEEQFKLKFRLATEPLDNPLQIRRVRRDMARVRTLIREKEAAAAAGNAA
ncbi:MAG: 50S ribosomal protein L29 [Planctomycetota bacterium]|jgi:large subunit ribosomal protein L29